MQLEKLIITKSLSTSRFPDGNPFVGGGIVQEAYFWRLEMRFLVLPIFLVATLGVFGVGGVEAATVNGPEGLDKGRLVKREVTAQASTARSWVLSRKRGGKGLGGSNAVAQSLSSSCLDGGVNSEVCSGDDEGWRYSDFYWNSAQGMIEVSLAAQELPRVVVPARRVVCINGKCAEYSHIEFSYGAEGMPLKDGALEVGLWQTIVEFFVDVEKDACKTKRSDSKTATSQSDIELRVIAATAVLNEATAFGRHMYNKVVFKVTYTDGGSESYLFLSHTSAQSPIPNTLVQGSGVSRCPG
jgi:hypothetical protein